MKNSNCNEINEVAAKRICCHCVGEHFLNALIVADGAEDCCSYCDHESKTITIAELAERIEEAFDDYYEQTSTQPDDFEAALLADRKSNYTWRRHGEEVLWAIGNAAEINERAAADVLSVLDDRHFDHELAKTGEEWPFAKDSHYTIKNIGCDDFNSDWHGFERKLKTEARFFSRSAQETLKEIFADLAVLRTSNELPVVLAAGPEANIKCLYRARVFAAENEKLEEALKFPWKHLGPPPMHAASAGRMNARGISVFYGATEPSTALAEVRPPVGSDVAVAKFSIERPLKLLDVEALKSVAASGSIFDRKHLRQVQRANFMGVLSAQISRPVMPNEEAFEYLATQAVADYLATEAKLDGIIFPSVQVGHKSLNVVLFHHASRVAEVPLPEGTDVSIGMFQYGEKDNSPDYVVWEDVTPPAAAIKPAEPDPLDFDIPSVINEAVDERIPTLSIDLGSVTVHHITTVSFVADAFPVKRHRFAIPESANI